MPLDRELHRDYLANESVRFRKRDGSPNTIHLLSQGTDFSQIDLNPRHVRQRTRAAHHTEKSASKLDVIARGDPMTVTPNLQGAILHTPSLTMVA
jgi:hypothetical protein